MTAVNPDSSQQAVVEAALVLLERMGLSPADLTAVPQPRRPVPTFAEYVPVVSAAVTVGTRRAYGSYWNRITEQWGGRRLDEPSPSDIRQLMVYVKTHVVARRNARGGRSAEEHLVAAPARDTRQSPSGTGSGPAIGGCGRCPGTFTELQPSKATVRSPPKRTPGVPGWASGPATTSNSAFSGVGRAAGAGHAAPSPTDTARPSPPVRRSAAVHPQRQEVRPDPGRQIAELALHRLRLLQDVIDQLERKELR